MIWDCLIIGAGPAGSTLALSLARRGLKILLVDQATFPRAKVCGGCLNGNALAALAQLGLAHRPAQLGGQPVRNLRLMSAHRFANVAQPEGISISRQAFDAALVDHCVREGVVVQQGVLAMIQKIDGNVCHVSLRSSRKTTISNCRIVILAHGLKAGTVSPRSRIGAGVVLEEAPHDYPLNTISMAVADGGYVGGVHVEGGRYDLAAAFDARFVQAKGSLGRAAVEVLRQAGAPPIPDLERVVWKGTPFLTRHLQSIAGERWFAVGDAAGYVEPFTGEGMAWAMTGALTLAPIVADAVEQWNESHPRRWQRAHTRLVARRQLQCRLLSRVLRSPTLSSILVRTLAHWPILAKPYVRSLSRGVAS